MTAPSPDTSGAPALRAVQGPRWGTVTLADEPSELLFAFAAHHAALGASEIHIFLDRPNKRLARLLGALPGVIVTQCDAAFWRTHGRRSRLQTKRQEIVANLAYARAGVAWLAHIDADEFIYPHHDLGAELAAMPEDIVGLRLPVKERVWQRGTAPEKIFEGLFRKKIPGRSSVQDLLLGDLVRYADRGLTGHVAGKTIARTGAGLTLGIHAPVVQELLPIMRSLSADLLHFDGLTPFHWVLKRLRYAHMAHAEKRMAEDSIRWRQIAALKAHAERGAALEFQEALMTLDAPTEARLRALRLVEDAPGFDPGAALARLAPDRAMDLSVARFDKRLRTRDAAFLKRLAETDPSAPR